jgi:hypothetical protein
MAKMKLKSGADVEDAEEAALFYNDALQPFSQSIAAISRSIDTAFEEIYLLGKEKDDLLYLVDFFIDVNILIII